MTPYTPQEAFDKAVAGLRAQNYERSFAHGMCLYRAPGGNKCAVGHLIPDELYFPGLENAGARQIVDGNLCTEPETAEDQRKLEVLGDMLRPTVGMLAHLQRLHDGDRDYNTGVLKPIPTREFEAGFAAIAARFGLVYTPPVTSPEVVA